MKYRSSFHFLGFNLQDIRRLYFSLCCPTCHFRTWMIICFQIGDQIVPKHLVLRPMSQLLHIVVKHQVYKPQLCFYKAKCSSRTVYPSVSTTKLRFLRQASLTMHVYRDQTQEMCRVVLSSYSFSQSEPIESTWIRVQALVPMDSICGARHERSLRRDHYLETSNLLCI